jgi:hypothetical protein
MVAEGLNHVTDLVALDIWYKPSAHYTIVAEEALS